ncbi:hypothetical protein JCM15519_06810 [Fundidesulfovibrio butyratiphilus]
MKTIIPVVMDDARLIDSSLVEDVEAYDPDTVYSLGGTCHVEHIVYTSLENSNVGIEPSANVSETSPVWSKGTYTNKWKPFDDYTNTQGKSADGSPITYTLDSSYCNGIALLNLDAASVSVVVKNAYGDEIFSQSTSLMTTVITNIEELFFSARRFSKSAWIEFPLRAHSTIEITITGASPAAGMIRLGEVKNLGRTRYEPKFSTTDYSVYSTDTFGQIYLSRGNYARNLSGDVYVDSVDIQDIENTKSELRATVTAFFCANKDDKYNLYNYMIISGYLKNFDVVIPRMTVLECSVEISGTV